MSLCCPDSYSVTPPLLIPFLLRDLVHVRLIFFLYQLYCDDNLSAVLARHRFSSTLRTELRMHFIASGSHLTVQCLHRADQAELGSLACFIRWLLHLT